ncbi:hypothetical protein F5884DRAFT_753238 [Xylogone sp. PMI_703]|nr:hypothetical protein F5884DRAFT_753238 [Xylogone sp. PMI_703]
MGESSSAAAEGEAKVRRSRASKPKVRTGCTTCKIRHVKCDETKPACMRCVKFGRQCDGYAQVKTSEPASSSSRTLQPKTGGGEAESSSYYTSSSTTNSGSSMDQMKIEYMVDFEDNYDPRNSHTSGNAS